LSEKETKEQEKTVQQAVEAKTEAQEAAGQEPATEDKAAEETAQAPEPTAIGDEKVAILKHDIYRRGGDDTTEAVSIELAVKNVSDVALGSVLFEAELYDIGGNVLDKVEHKTVELKPGIKRTIRINYSEPNSDKVRSYCVRAAKIAMTPEPAATGNEMVKILKHNINIGTEYYRSSASGADIAVRNVSDKTIATLVFEAVFYDIEGNILDTVKHSEIDLKPNTSRAINIRCNKQGTDSLKSYNVKIARVTTTDVEKVQLRRHEIRTTDNGEEEVRGAVKNISNVKADAALVATFLDPKKESIGTRVIIIRDIEPNNVRHFHFLFKPMEGDRVRSYTLGIGDLVE
jgi:hypothetical protein